VSILNRLSEYLAVMGIPGLLIISFLDSAFMPLAGGPDAVILVLATLSKGDLAMAFWIALSATVGSTAGSMILYGIGLKGGEKALGRFNPDRVAQMEQKMRVYGAWVIVGSVIAPPPFPTKLVVLAAGVLRISKIRFAASVFIGRLIRYSLIAWLAAKFGEQAAEIIKAHSKEAAVILVVILLLLCIIRIWRMRKNKSVV